MKFKSLSILTFAAACSLFFFAPSIIANQNLSQLFVKKLSYQEIASLLNWTPSKGACNLCDGYFKQPEILTKHPIPPPFQTTTTHITAKGPTTFRQKGVSVLRKNVVATQPGRILTADKAYIYRGKNGKISRIHLVGHVHLMENGKLIVSDVADVNLIHHTLTLNHSVYHLSEKTVKSLAKRKFIYDAWGRATKVHRDANAILTLWKATYTTCSPLNPAWYLYASYLKLDKKKEVGIAHNVVLRFLHVPVLYLPYFRFPLAKKRKTGFLFPSFGYSHENGFQLGLPFYWNMAPNYDMTITPKLMTTRGVQFNTLFRYITQSSYGNIYLSFLPADQQFQRDKNEILATTSVNSQTLPYLNQLKNDSNNRGYIHMDESTQFNKEWKTDLYINYVTDAYYFQNFGSNYITIRNNQLLNQFDLSYEGIHWQFILLGQAYQTLHNINQSSNPPAEYYERLPEFDFSAYYPNIIDYLDFSLIGQSVYFFYNSDFPPVFSFQRPIGQRFHFRPTFSVPVYFASGFFIPSVSLDNTDYFIKKAVPSPGINRPGFNASRNIPIINVDMGWYFNRKFHFFHGEYLQTFEPRVFYLYVPFVNQNNFPNFDTQVLPFSFNQLFLLNRFTGFDRLDDANQVSLALTSRILNADTSNEILNIGLGFIYYFVRPKVTIPAIDNPNEIINPVNGNISPIVAEMTYFPALHWSIVGNLAWDVHHEQINNGSITIHYSNLDNDIFSVGYDFVHEFSGIPVDSLGLSNNTHYFYAGVSLPLSQRWNALGYWYYNIAKQRSDSYFAGLQYSTCCWAVRLVASRNFTGTKPDSTSTNIMNRFRTTFYVQFLLKGLGSFGNNDPSSLLEHSLSGYQDPFINRLHT